MHPTKLKRASRHVQFKTARRCVSYATLQQCDVCSVCDARDSTSFVDAISHQYARQVSMVRHNMIQQIGCIVSAQVVPLRTLMCLRLVNFQMVMRSGQSLQTARRSCKGGIHAITMLGVLAEMKALHQRRAKKFPHRDSNPGLLGESQLS